MRHLLKGGAYSDLSGDGVVLIKGLRLFEAQRLLKKCSTYTFKTIFLLLFPIHMQITVNVGDCRS